MSVSLRIGLDEMLGDVGEKGIMFGGVNWNGRKRGAFPQTLGVTEDTTK